MDQDDRDLFLPLDGMSDGLARMVMLAAIGGGLAFVTAGAAIVAVISSLVRAAA